MTVAKTRREREVWEACDAVWEEMHIADEPIEKLTGDRIRAKLQSLGYARGNQNQIYTYRKTWKLSMGFDGQVDEPDQRQQLSARLEQVVKYVMDSIDAEAQEHVEKIRQEYLDKASSIQASNQKLEEALMKSNETRLELNDRFKELSSNYESAMVKLAQLEKENVKNVEKLSSQNIQFESLVTRHEEKKKELTLKAEKAALKFEEKLNEKEANFHKKIDALREANEADRVRWMLELDGEKQKVQELKRQEVVSQSKLTAANKDNVLLERQLERQKQELNKADIKYEKALKDYNFELKAQVRQISKMEGLVLSRDQHVSYLQSQIDKLQEMLVRLDSVDKLEST